MEEVPNHLEDFTISEIKTNAKGEMFFFLFDKRMTHGFHFTIHKDGTFHVRITDPKKSSIDMQITNVISDLIDTSKEVLRYLVGAPPSGYTYMMSYVTDISITPQFIIDPESPPIIPVKLREGFSEEMEFLTYADTKDLLIDLKTLKKANKKKTIYNFSLYVPKLKQNYIVLPSTIENAHHFFKYVDVNFDYTEWANEGLVPLAIPSKKKDLQNVFDIMEKNNVIKAIIQFFEDNDKLNIFSKVDETFRNFH